MFVGFTAWKNGPNSFVKSVESCAALFFFFLFYLVIAISVPEQIVSYNCGMARGLFEMLQAFNQLEEPERGVWSVLLLFVWWQETKRKKKKEKRKKRGRSEQPIKNQFAFMEGYPL